MDKQENSISSYNHGISLLERKIEKDITKLDYLSNGFKSSNLYPFLFLFLWGFLFFFG